MWNKVADLIKTVAPILGGAVDSDIGKAIVKKVTGHSTPETIFEALSNEPALLQELKIAEDANQVALVALAVQSEEIKAKDRASARQMRIAFMSADHTDWLGVGVAVCVLITFVGTCFTFLWKSVQGEQVAESTVLMMLLTVVIREFGGLANFFFGKTTNDPSHIPNGNGKHLQHRSH